MNELNLATCHCIISHPSKPKFMVIRHKDGWLPPVVKFPADGFVGDKAWMISDGIMNKYGLKVTVLRHLYESYEHHCIELEQQAPGSTKNMDAVWVGRKEYRQFRNSRPGQPDPLGEWLEEARKNRFPRRRPPWEGKGWFRKAASWMEHELDRHGIQVTGSVHQHRVCRRSSAVLRVRSSQGVHYLKAAWDAPPNEAALTAALAERWPDSIAEPLSFDRSRNWLLMQANGEDESEVLGDRDYLAAAGTLARIQLESSRNLDEWINLGCQNRDIEQLDDFLGRYDSLIPALQSGKGGLSDDELVRLKSRFRELRDVCNELQAYEFPETLVHTDFHRSNLVRNQGNLWIIDWADTAISHPFFSVHELMRSIEPMGKKLQAVTDEHGEMPVRERIKDAFMAPFSDFGSPDQMQKAFALTAELYDAWKLYLWSHQMAHIEPESVSFGVWARTIQRFCRNLLDRDLKTAAEPDSGVR